MLEKKPGIISIIQLRAILHLEADFNGMNKIVFNSQLIPAIERNNAIPHKIISGRRS